MSDDNELIRVQLARIEGKQDVTNERLETANKINEERHIAISARLSAIDGRINAHGERISGLEQREVGRDGERRGIALGGRALWAGIGFLPGAAIALMKLLT